MAIGVAELRWLRRRDGPRADQVRELREPLGLGHVVVGVMMIVMGIIEAVDDIWLVMVDHEVVVVVVVDQIISW